MVPGAGKPQLDMGLGAKGLLNGQVGLDGGFFQEHTSCLPGQAGCPQASCSRAVLGRPRHTAHLLCVHRWAVLCMGHMGSQAVLGPPFGCLLSNVLPHN